MHNSIQIKQQHSAVKWVFSCHTDEMCNPNCSKELFEKAKRMYIMIGSQTFGIRSSDNDSTGFWPPGSLHTLGADGHI